MNPEQLRAFLQKNKVPLGAAGAAAVAGLALMRNRSAKSDTPAQASLPALGSPLSSGGAPVSGSAGSYYPVSYVGASGGYDSTSSDVYNAIQPQLEALQRMYDKTSPIPVTAPAPIASTMTAPSYNGNYLRYGNGTTIVEVQSDGSLFHVGQADWDKLAGMNGGKYATARQLEKTGPDPGGWYSAAGNIAAKNAGTAPQQYVKDEATGGIKAWLKPASAS